MEGKIFRAIHVPRTRVSVTLSRSNFQIVGRAWVLIGAATVTFGSTGPELRTLRQLAENTNGKLRNASAIN